MMVLIILECFQGRPCKGHASLPVSKVSLSWRMEEGVVFKRALRVSALSCQVCFKLHGQLDAGCTELSCC